MSMSIAGIETCTNDDGHVEHVWPDGKGNDYWCPGLTIQPKQTHWVVTVRDDDGEAVEPTFLFPNKEKSEAFSRELSMEIGRADYPISAFTLDAQPLWSNYTGADVGTIHDMWKKR